MLIAKTVCARTYVQCLALGPAQSVSKVLDTHATLATSKTSEATDVRRKLSRGHNTFSQMGYQLLEILCLVGGGTFFLTLN